jgi:ectoine hydroxylase-related dioxygenase (phytanoyl-CoA dioxygenase family)
VCDAILLPNCASYQLNIAHVLDRGPGSEQQFIHRDELVWVHLPDPHPEVQLASVIALVDFTADNGATRVVPGSHRWPKDRVATPEELVPAEMAAGSAIIYLGSTLHGGGANTTASPHRSTSSARCPVVPRPCSATPLTTPSPRVAATSAWSKCRTRSSSWPPAGCRASRSAS